jgi:hypothetical protein
MDSVVQVVVRVIEVHDRRVAEHHGQPQQDRDRRYGGERSVITGDPPGLLFFFLNDGGVGAASHVSLS